MHFKLSKISPGSKRGTKNSRKNNISRGTDVSHLKSSRDSEKETNTICVLPRKVYWALKNRWVFGRCVGGGGGGGGEEGQEAGADTAISMISVEPGS